MDIFSEILSALETEERVMLATIISTSGSTPASALSKMLVKNNGIVSVGTVGGGCMEGDVLLHANRLYNSNKAKILTFHLNEDDLEHGLICGGSLDVLIEPITKVHASLLKDLKSMRDEGEDGVLATIVGQDGILRDKVLIRISELNDNGRKEKLTSLSSQLSHPTSNLERSIEKAFHRQETQRITTEKGELILEPIAGTPSLIIFGGGHVSKFVSRAASMAGFRVTIVDDRKKYSNPKRFPEAVQTLALDFMEAMRQLTIKKSTYIVIVTRGHRFDEDILGQVINTPAKYIGMIGSKRKVLTAYQHLSEKGVSIELLRRVYAPVGIDIGAISAEEIGISIVAQLIRVRRGEQAPLQNKSESMTELFSNLDHNFLVHQ